MKFQMVYTEHGIFQDIEGRPQQRKSSESKICEGKKFLNENLKKKKQQTNKQTGEKHLMTDSMNVILRQQSIITMGRQNKRKDTTKAHIHTITTAMTTLTIYTALNYTLLHQQHQEL